MPLCALVLILGAGLVRAAGPATDVIFTEIMYHTGNDQVDHEYVELTNRGTGSVDLGSWSLAGAVTFTFPSPTTLHPGEAILVCDDAQACRMHYGLAETLGTYQGNLANEGQVLRLNDPRGMPVLTVAYQTTWPWPSGAAGLGHSLELISLGADPSLPQSWGLGTPHSPGRPNRAMPSPGDGPIVIHEIMYHAASEDEDHEYIELLNRSDAAVDLTGWSLASAVDYPFSAGLTLGPGQYLVVARSIPGFVALYKPQGVVVAGPYQGKLSNAGETLGLLNAQGEIVDVVSFRDSGQWPKAADGEGPSLELIHPGVDNNHHRAWAAGPVGGTPGRPNGTYVADPAPIVEVLRHDPAVPTPADRVGVTAWVTDEALPSEVLLHVRNETGPWTIIPMVLKQAPGEGWVWLGQVPAQAQNAVVEFYVSAQDGAGQQGLAPPLAPGRTCLVQVDSRVHQTQRPLYRIVMTAADYNVGGHSLLQRNTRSDELLNCTFIAGQEIRYNAGIRLRGFSSRAFEPKNFRVEFTLTDHLFQGLERLNLNGVDDDPRSAGTYEYAMGSHEVGHDFLDRAGQLTLDHQLIALVIHNQFLPNYIYLSPIDDVFARQHFAGDDGNLYNCVRPYGASAPHADLDYRGINPDAYRPDYFKRTNEDEDDWTDLIGLLETLNHAPNSEYVARVRACVDVEQWMGFFATVNLIGYEEGGVHTDSGTEYAMYRRESDGRFLMIPWDFDALFHEGAQRSLFTQRLPPIKRFIEHPEFKGLYYDAFRRLLDGPFSEQEMRKATDRYRGLIQDTFLDQVNSFVRQRRAYVLSKLPPAGG